MQVLSAMLARGLEGFPTPVTGLRADGLPHPGGERGREGGRGNLCLCASLLSQVAAWELLCGLKRDVFCFGAVSAPQVPVFGACGMRGFDVFHKAGGCQGRGPRARSAWS